MTVPEKRSPACATMPTAERTSDGWYCLHVDAVDQELARRRQVQPADQPAERCLARADAPDDADPLARLHREVQARSALRSPSLDR